MEGFIKALAIVPSLYDRSPGQRFRIEQWEPYLRKYGVEITYAPFEDKALSKIIYTPGKFAAKASAALRAFGRRLLEIRDLTGYDLVYVFREAALFGPAIFERMIHRSGVPMVFDFDDAIFLRNEGSVNGYLNYLKLPGKTKTICRLSAHVIAGNPYLAEYAGRVNRNVSIVPTTIDTRKYDVVQKSEKKPLTIGWSGSFSTVPHLDTLRPALKKLALKREFKLRVIGAPMYDMDDIDVEVIQWRSATELADLNPIDIGVMPLPDNAWSRGKCGLKALQYMAIGVPTICSPVGVNSEIIHDGVNGFIAADDDEWVAKLSDLLDSRELRAEIGAKGRKTVEEKYSAECQAPRVAEIFRQVVSERARKS